MLTAFKEQQRHYREFMEGMKVIALNPAALFCPEVLLAIMLEVLQLLLLPDSLK